MIGVYLAPRVFRMTGPGIATGERMDSPLKSEFEWFLAHKADLLKKYDGKFVVIKNQTVLAAYDDRATAVSETVRAHELGTFLVQKVEPGDQAYTQSFHSRAAFLR